jgi:hypothetical protein
MKKTTGRNREFPKRHGNEQKGEEEGEKQPTRTAKEQRREEYN